KVEEEEEIRGSNHRKDLLSFAQVCQKAVKYEDEAPILSTSTVLGKQRLSLRESRAKVRRRTCIACGATTDKFILINGTEWKLESILSRVIGTEVFRFHVERAVRYKLSTGTTTPPAICAAHLSGDRLFPQEVLSDVELTAKEEEVQRASLVPHQFTPRFSRSILATGVPTLEERANWKCGELRNTECTVCERGTILANHTTTSGPSPLLSGGMRKTEKRQVYAAGSHHSSIDQPGPSSSKRIKVEEEEEIIDGSNHMQDLMSFAEDCEKAVKCEDELVRVL
ncbi:hypothetical protein PFISCL1PPCAC_21489, partial [Pristionchus fissidentatus]